MKRGVKEALPGGRVRLRGLPAAGPERVVAFISRYCRLTKGKGAGQRVQLRPWQRDIVESLFAEPRPRTGYVQVARKNGKSYLAACLALYALVADGEEGAEVYCVAGDERQARIVWNHARRMVQLDPELSKRVYVYRDSLQYQAADATLEPLPSEADLRQGLNPSFVVFDEVCGQRDSRLWDAMSLASGARARPLLLGITTPGFDRDSLAFRLYEHGKRGDDPDFFFRVFEPAGAGDWHDENRWHEANPALGDWLTVEEMRAAARITPESPFRRFRLGEWTEAERSWLPFRAWEACVDLERVVAEGEDIVAAFDGSYNGDSTAIVACTMSDPAHFFVIGEWASAGEGDDWVVDRVAVDAAVAAMFEKWNVVRFACDPPGWEREIGDWTDRYTGDIVKAFPTHVRSRMSPAVGSFYAAVAGRELTHDGDSRLATHLANCVLVDTPEGGVIRKQTRWSTRKIDLAVCAVVALDQRTRFEPPKQRSNKAVFV